MLKKIYKYIRKQFNDPIYWFYIGIGCGYLIFFLTAMYAYKIYT